MFSALFELLRTAQSPSLNLYLVVVGYFWLVWSIKIAYLLFYRPDDNDFRAPVSVVMPTYNEDRGVLAQAIGLVLGRPADEVAEIVIVIDYREPGIREWLESTLPADPRVQVVETQVAGKRNSLALGIRTATREIVVSVESDVFINEATIPEIVKPFADPQVGGVVGDQRIYQATSNALYWVNSIAESVKYNIGYPAMSAVGQVTVLSGRCVAYRREAVLPLLPGLTGEVFLGRLCFSGDDGRMTSLLLERGWKTKYQKSSVIETISPPTWRDLIRQQMRWFRNTGRRTLRALFWDRLWVWRKCPMAAWQMVTTWTGAMMIGVLLFAVGRSIVTRSWFWFGTDWQGVALRIALLVIGITITRFIRSLPALESFPVRGRLWIVILPWYGFVLWVVKLYAFATMNRQGWVTRETGLGAGGFGAKVPAVAEATSG